MSLLPRTTYQGLRAEHEWGPNCSIRPNSDQLVIADFGIAKHLEDNETLTSLAGSPGYAGRRSTFQDLRECAVRLIIARDTAPEVLLRQPHGKPVDLWSVG